MATIVGLFRSIADADRAIHELNSHGFKEEEISLVARQKVIHEAEDDYDTTVEVVEGAAVGTTSGMTLGGAAGMLVGLGVLAIPGVGPALAAGSLATVLGSTVAGAGVGAVTGGLLFGLTRLGVPEEEAQFYAEGVKRGGILIAVQTDAERAPQVESIMRQTNALDMDATRQAWQQEGWQRFDESSEPGESYPRL